jgi:radical SAM protein with 4Fe4S-binding SPASM domain
MLGCPRQLPDFEFSGEDVDGCVGKARLLSLEVELSRACNFCCVYCPLEEGSALEEELSEREVREVILQAKELGAKRIILVGGEPTIHGDFLGVVRFIRSQDLEVEIFTNGSGITADVAGQLFEERVRVVLKMDTLAEETQNILTGKQDSFAIIQRAFRNLGNAGYPSEDAFLAVEAVVCRRNIDELVGLWRWLRDRGVTPYLQVITPQGRARGNEWLHVEPWRLHELFTEIAEIDREEYGQFWDPQPPFPGGGCMRHESSCRVCSQGDVMACIGLDIPLGNIRDQKLHDIIEESEVLEDLRNHRRMLKGPCRSCEKGDVCYGCRGAAYQLTGDHLASDPSCWKNADRQDEISRLPFPAAEIIPQRSPMRVIDAVIRLGERSGEVSATVSDDMPFSRDDGTMDELAYFEMMAQSIAALEGFKRVGTSESVAGGYLVGAHKLEILGTARVGDRLGVYVEKSSRFGRFGILRATVSRDSTVLARGEIRVWRDEPGGGEVAMESSR